MVDIKIIRSKSLSLGRASCLAAHREELLRFLFELREQGMAVLVSMVAVKAAQISQDFALKSRMAKYNSVRRFVRSQGLVFRLGTNESQRSPTETAAEALDFMNNEARPKVKDQPGQHPDFILNMDQTPIPFTYNARKTLEIAGRCTVHVRKSTNDTKRATFAKTVTASGKLLKPLLVFKGMAVLCSASSRHSQMTCFTHASQTPGWTRRSCFYGWIKCLPRLWQLHRML